MGNLNSDQYISNFNWLKTWLNRHTTEILEFVLTTCFVVFITALVFKIIKKNNLKNYNYLLLIRILKIVFILTFLLFIFKNPNIRMNHHLFLLPMILAIDYFFSSRSLLVKKNFYIYIIILCLSFNLLKNIKRIHELDYKNNYMQFVSHKIDKQKEYKIDNFKYYLGWFGNGPISNTELKNKNFNKFFIFKMIY